MGRTVYLPTWMVDFYGKCIYVYLYSISWRRCFYHHRFVLRKPYLCRNALLEATTMCCSHSCHSPLLSCSVELSQNQGLVVLEGRLESHVQLFSIETQTTWYQYGFNTSSVHCCSQREGSFVGLLHTKNILQVVVPMDLLKSGCPKAAVLRVSVAFLGRCFVSGMLPSLEANRKVPVSVWIRQPNNNVIYIYYISTFCSKNSLEMPWSPLGL